MASPKHNVQQNEDEVDETTVPRSGSEETPQPVEVEGTTWEHKPAEDPLCGKFTWRIEDFPSLAAKVVYSGPYELGYSKWRILIVNESDYLSLYLAVADTHTLPYGWSIHATFRLAIVNQVNRKLTIQKVSKHRFSAEESDRGYPYFMSIELLQDPNLGYLVDGLCLIEAEVVADGVRDLLLYDSKKETGFVGLINQGATCYLNALLQTLYHIPYFRKVLYRIPTNDDEPSKAIPLALQRLFYELQHNDNSVATNELTASFGWTQHDVSIQRDIHEMNRVLCTTLEKYMQGTVVDGAIRQLFEGHHKNYIECINVDYKSGSMESFYDLQLDVKGCSDVYASLDKFVAVEYLDGDNKYHADRYGLQVARKGVLFVDFPPVLQLHLKRFEYDYVRNTMLKINDRYEFPLQLDLDIDDGRYLSSEADRSVRNLYALHSVVVHCGGVHGGHYYTFIRPDLSTHWYKFDDERVTKEGMHEAMEELYGGEEVVMQTDPGTKHMKISNAYMLVYIRESDKEKILCDVDETDFVVHLRERLRREFEEKKEKAKADDYTFVKVATDKDFSQQVGIDIYSELVDFEKLEGFAVGNFTLFHIFKEKISTKFGVPVQFQRFWLWSMCENGSCRPVRPLTSQEETLTVGHLNELYGIRDELKLFLELECDQDLLPLPCPDLAKDDILLFFKTYNPEKEELSYAGRLFVKHFDMPIFTLAKLNALAGFDPDEDLELFKEIRNQHRIMYEPIDTWRSFKSSQIVNGDTVYFQKSLSPQIKHQLRLPSVRAFFKQRQNIQVHFS